MDRTRTQQIYLSIDSLLIIIALHYITNNIALSAMLLHLLSSLRRMLRHRRQKITALGFTPLRICVSTTMKKDSLEGAVVKRLGVASF